MGFWEKGRDDVQKGKGAPNPSSHASSQAREQYEAGRKAEQQRQAQLQQQRNNSGNKK